MTPAQKRRRKAEKRAGALMDRGVDNNRADVDVFLRANIDRGGKDGTVELMEAPDAE